MLVVWVVGLEAFDERLLKRYDLLCLHDEKINFAVERFTAQVELNGQR